MLHPTLGWGGSGGACTTRSSPAHAPGAPNHLLQAAAMPRGQRTCKEGGAREQVNGTAAHTLAGHPACLPHLASSMGCSWCGCVLGCVCLGATLPALFSSHPHQSLARLHPHKPTAAGPAQQPAQLSSQWATSALQKSTPPPPMSAAASAKTTPDFVPTVTSPRGLQRHMRAACTAQPRLHFCGRPQHTSTSRTAE